MTRAAWWFTLVLPLAAQPKLLVNAQLKQQSAAAGLEGAFRALLPAQPQPAWIGYSVPAVRSRGLGCEYVRDNPSTAGVVHLEQPGEAVVLFRVEGGAVNRIRTLSPDCEIDAGGLPVYWLTEVQPAQSVALLASFAAGQDRPGDSLGAIARHADPAADQALDRFLAPGQPESVRMRVVALEGQARGRHGFEALKQLIAADGDGRIRERAVASLAGSREPEATALLVAIAGTNPASRLREQALTALARRGGPEAVAALTKAIESDSDLEVRRRAVSALGSLPDGAGVPLLIRVAKTADRPELRRQAMSALGGSRDPRATVFFEEILK